MDKATLDQAKILFDDWIRDQPEPVKSVGAIAFAFDAFLAGFESGFAEGSIE